MSDIVNCGKVDSFSLAGKNQSLKESFDDLILILSNLLVKESNLSPILAKLGVFFDDLAIPGHKTKSY